MVVNPYKTRRKLQYNTASTSTEDQNTNKKQKVEIQEKKSQLKQRPSFSFFRTPTKQQHETKKDDEESSFKITSSPNKPFLNKLVAYTDEQHSCSQSVLSDGEKIAYLKIVDNYEIPDDVESSSKYGPISGMAYEERIMRMYSLGQLKPKKKETSNNIPLCAVCVYCGKDGHYRRDCEELLKRN